MARLPAPPPPASGEDVGSGVKWFGLGNVAHAGTALRTGNVVRRGGSLADVAFGGKLIFVLLFAGGFVVLGFLFGYLCLYTNSVWPASLAHSAGNAVPIGATTLISNPVVFEYLNQILGLMVAIATTWLAYKYLERGRVLSARSLEHSLRRVSSE